MARSRRKFATFHNEASDEQYVRYESSSGDERTGSVAAKYRIAAAHVRKQIEKGAKNGGRELKAAAANAVQQAERNEKQMQRLSLETVCPWRRHKK